MNDPKTERQQIIELQDEIKALRKQLSDRSSAFNSQLNRQTDTKYYEMTKAIGEAIRSTVGQHFVHCFKHRQMRLDCVSSFGSSSYWTVYFSSEDEIKIKDHIADYELVKFKESLDNFAWAVNVQQQGQ